MPYVFTNGCFDLFHAGHVSTLEYCKDLAGPDGIVHVGLNSDVSVMNLKGMGRPIIPQAQRYHILLSMRDVDRVSIFDERTPYDLIKKIKPDFIVKGPDYVGHENEVVGADIAEVKCITKEFYPGLSTSYIMGLIRENNK
jgi:D-beta-D-heptose 7-phosphate kinase/D-beta-D-heptose 1-phosphate adenosyltransferase